MAELTTKKYLDQAGLKAFWAKAKQYIEDNSADGAEVQNAINAVALSYANKTITLKNGSTTLGTVDCTDFIKDSFLKSGEVIDVDGSKVLRLTLLTVERPGEAGTESTVDIDVNDLFKVDASNITVSGGDYDGKTVQEVVTAVDSRLDALEAIDQDAYKTADSTLKSEVTTAYEAADSAVYASITALSTTEVETVFA